ncbi:hypothetical protein EV421DRAFT_1903772 [Armillaria borealis]|uniref:Uncharacterized protein n=1 Tax=Armillaria borealis TaxID=47425 RepID=A0AA39MRF6_9AGAR|nr:hypothetical protein EV421DRAFT_1903772 [Armillaria borealis]
MLDFEIGLGSSVHIVAVARWCIAVSLIIGFLFANPFLILTPICVRGLYIIHTVVDGVPQMRTTINVFGIK